jgi:predicted enzyme related to lactoylglutathione lyase
MTTTGFQSIVYPVRDLEAAKAVYAALLGQPHTDQPYYVGFNVDGQEIGLNPHGHQQGMTGPVAYWHVADAAAAVEALVAAGAKAQGEPQDVGGGTLMATVTDADGNPIGLIQKP